MIAEDRAEFVVDHADAAATLLERYARLIRSGTKPVEDAGRELVLIARIMARET